MKRKNDPRKYTYDDMFAAYCEGVEVDPVHGRRHQPAW